MAIEVNRLYLGFADGFVNAVTSARDGIFLALGHEP